MATRFPMPVRCYDRAYLVQTQEELDQLLYWLVNRRLALANRFRVGGAWPRGREAMTISYCDRCRVQMTEPRLVATYAGGQRWDLCEGCAKSFDVWLGEWQLKSATHFLRPLLPAPPEP